MNVLICGFVLFGTFFLFHTVVWRMKKPASTIKVLVFLFCLILSAGMIMLIHFGNIYPNSLILPHELIDYIYIVVFFFSLFIAYFFSYPAIEASSPSLAIILLIFRCRNRGISATEIRELLKDSLLVEPRLKDLVDAKMVDLSGSIYKINRKGILFIQPFIAYRNLLKLGKGG